MGVGKPAFHIVDTDLKTFAFRDEIQTAYIIVDEYREVIAAISDTVLLP